MSQSHMSQRHKIEKMNEIKATVFNSSVFTGESAEPSSANGLLDVYCTWNQKQPLRFF